MTILTHNGTLTVTNPKTGEHRTYKISTVKQGPLAGKRILSYMYGTDNTSEYKGFAFVTEQGVSLWGKYKGQDFFEKSARMLANIDKYPVEVLFATKCRKCNRKLTNPESIISGIGPECAKISY